jgi:hypothetical protein
MSLIVCVCVRERRSYAKYRFEECRLLDIVKSEMRMRMRVEYAGYLVMYGSVDMSWFREDEDNDDDVDDILLLEPREIKDPIYLPRFFILPITRTSSTVIKSALRDTQNYAQVIRPPIHSIHNRHTSLAIRRSNRLIHDWWSEVSNRNPLYFQHRSA